MSNGIERIREQFPWPTSRPRLPFDPHGWFGWCHEDVLSCFLSANTSVVLELGSWLGKSTRFILDKAPFSTVIAIDHWMGDAQTNEDQDAVRRTRTLYEQFLANCWDYGSRLIPVRARTTDGAMLVGSLGISPDVIFIDAAHDYQSAKLDIFLMGSLFPNAMLCGDDYGGKWDGVRQAVDEYCATKHGQARVYSVAQAWAIVDAGFVPPNRTRPHPNQTWRELARENGLRGMDAVSFVGANAEWELSDEERCILAGGSPTVAPIDRGKSPDPQAGPMTTEPPKTRDDEHKEDAQ